MPKKIPVAEIELLPIFDSLGNMTVEATINHECKSSAPCGTSSGSHEAKGLDAKQAIINFERLKNQFIGSFAQAEFDARLKDHAEKLGSSLTTALSLAFFLCDELAEPKPETQLFPNLVGVVLSGGKHAPSKGPEIQEFLVIPKAKTIADAVGVQFEIWKRVRDSLKKNKYQLGLDYEAGWCADISNEKALDIVTKIASDFNAKIGVDVAASSFFSKGRYVYRTMTMTPNEHMDYIIGLTDKYKLYYVEDPVHEDDFESFSYAHSKLKKTLVIGDDLTATNPERFSKAIDMRAINGVIIKPNQAGNVSDCLEIINRADKLDIATVASHRSGETCSGALSHLALRTIFAKFGIAGIRTAKLNELLRLWHECKNPVMRKL